MLDILGRSSSINIYEFNEKLVCVNLEIPQIRNFCTRKIATPSLMLKEIVYLNLFKKTVLIYESFAIYTQNFEI